MYYSGGLPVTSFLHNMIFNLQHIDIHIINKKLVGYELLYPAA